MKNFLIKFLPVFCFMSAIGQDLSQDYLDSLGDEELLTLFDNIVNDSIGAELVARAYLNRAKLESDTIKMARGYDRLARIFDPKKNISYADSIIAISRSSDHITYPTLGYIIKAFEYSNLADLQKEYKNLLIAYELSLEKGNLIQQVYILNRMIFTQAKWGSVNSALNLQFKRDELINDPKLIGEFRKSMRPELQSNVENLFMEEKISSLECFIFCYLKLEKYDKAQFYLSKLRRELIKYNGDLKKYHRDWLFEASMEVNYFFGNYDSSIKIADSLLARLDSVSNQIQSKNIFLFKGLSNLKLNRNELGFRYLLKSDSIYEANIQNLNHHYDRMLFVSLYQYYSEKNYTKKRIEYLDKILFIDSILKVNYQYFEPQYIKNFETPRLLEEKESLIASLKKENGFFKKFNWLIISILLSSLTFLFYYINRQLIYKKRFKKLLERSSEIKQDFGDNRKTEISTDIVEDIQRKLLNFEKENLFLTHNISLQLLAKKFHTNSNYLSRVINLKMEKNFSQYIHDLRIEYSMNELLSNPKFRNYTIKAIAEDCGYTNAESFSRAFYKKNGIYPSYYIKKLNQKEN